MGKIVQWSQAGILLMLMAAVSCQRPNLDTESTSSLGARVSSNPNLVLEKVARKLARSLEDQQMRSFIKSEALKRFDGDNDILFTKVSSFAASNVAARATLNDVEDAQTLPLLNVAVPVHIEKWDEHNYVPLVAFVPEEFDEKTTKLIKAFDAKGNVTWLDAQKAPDQPVVVVNYNERMTLQSDGSYKLVEYAPVDRVDKAGARIASIPLSTSPCTYPARSYGEYIYLTGLASHDISPYESWANGAPEIAFKTFAANGGVNYSSTTPLRNIGEGGSWYPSARSNMNDPTFWWSPLPESNTYISIAYWTKEVYGQTLLFYFWEVDGGKNEKPINLSTTFRTGKDTEPGATVQLSTAFNIGNRDEEIGPIPVDYLACPPQQTQLSPGRYFSWYDVSPNLKMSLSPQSPANIAPGGWSSY